MRAPTQIIKRALHPYPDGLVIVTKLGARRGSEKSWIPALSRQELTDGAHDNLMVRCLSPLGGGDSPRPCLM